jgi:hypothetical protein
LQENFPPKNSILLNNLTCVVPEFPKENHHKAPRFGVFQTRPALNFPQFPCNPPVAVFTVRQLTIPSSLPVPPGSAAMSDHSSHHPAPASAEQPLFSAVEVEQFSADDVTAGSAIGKMLSALFLYTVIAMSIASWWTWSSIQEAAANRQAQPAAAAETEH